MEDIAIDNAASLAERSTALWSSNYARNCHGNDSMAPSCQIFTVPTIYSSSFSYISCPFAKEMCLDPTKGAMKADSGRINSNKHLSLNSRQRDSFDYRRVTVCAPLVTEGFSQRLNENFTVAANGSNLEFNYGNSFFQGTGKWNFTYSRDLNLYNISGRVYTTA
jgi:hypothetical protein